MRFWYLGLSAVVAGLLSGGPGRAQIVYEFDVAGVPVTAPLALTQGGTLDLQVYIREQPPGTVLATQKLFAAGGRVTFDNPAGSGTPSGVAAVLSAADVTRNPQFNDTGTVLLNVTSTVADLIEAVINPTTDLVAPDALNRILVATYRFHGLAPGTLTVTARRYPAPTSAVVTGQGNALDAQLQTGTATINVVPVPEPSTLLLVGAAAVGWGLRRRRRAAPAV
jgi:hypothetical protein